MTAGTLFDDLLAAQGEMPNLQKTGLNPHFGNKYVPLEELMEKVIPVLNKHGLVLMQLPTVVDGHAGLTSSLIHRSGERIESTMLLMCAKDDPQGQGSAITYARRYALMSMLGLSADADDDAQRSMQTAKTNGNGRPAPRGGAVREVLSETEPPVCPSHGSMAFVKAGTSKAGKPYPAFWSCPERRSGCQTKTVDAADWKSQEVLRKDAYDPDDVPNE